MLLAGCPVLSAAVGGRVQLAARVVSRGRREVSSHFQGRCPPTKRHSQRRRIEVFVLLRRSVGTCERCVPAAERAEIGGERVARSHACATAHRVTWTRKTCGWALKSASCHLAARHLLPCLLSPLLRGR
jgi:hypothetical protein